MKSKNKNKLKAKFLIASCLIISGIVGLTGISPATNAQGSDRGIIISPPIIEATIPKGQKSGYTVRVENDNPTSPVQLPKWLQSLINPRLDTNKITTNQDLTNGKIFGEKTWNLNNYQPIVLDNIIVNYK